MDYKTTNEIILKFTYYKLVFLPVISVIIPVFNLDRYILRCLKSIVFQTLPDNIEIIVVDDKSSDRSYEIVEKYKISGLPHNRDLIVIKQDVNKGQAAARNLGVKTSRGKYIFFIDGDDYLKPNGLLELYAVAEERGNEIVQGQVIDISETGKIIDTSQDQLIGTVKGKDLWEIGNKWKPVAWNKLILRKCIIDNALWFKEGFYYEDLYWSALIAQAQIPIYVISISTYYYVHRLNSTSNTLTSKHINSFIILVCQLFHLIERVNITNSSQKKIIFRYFETVRSIAIDYTFDSQICQEEKERLFKALQNYNLQNFWKCLTNDELGIKIKSKILPLYFGNLGFIIERTKNKIFRIIKCIKKKIH